MTTEEDSGDRLTYKPGDLEKISDKELQAYLEKRRKEREKAK